MQLAAVVKRAERAHSREFDALVRAVGECKSKADEDAILDAETAALKVRLKDGKLDGRALKEALVRLLYVDMLGAGAGFGAVRALQACSDGNLATKKVPWWGAGGGGDRWRAQDGARRCAPPRTPSPPGCLPRRIPRPRPHVRPHHPRRQHPGPRPGLGQRAGGRDCADRRGAARGPRHRPRPPPRRRARAEAPQGACPQKGGPGAAPVRAAGPGGRGRAFARRRAVPLSRCALRPRPVRHGRVLAGPGRVGCRRPGPRAPAGAVAGVDFEAGGGRAPPSCVRLPPRPRPFPASVAHSPAVPAGRGRPGDRVPRARRPARRHGARRCGRPRRRPRRRGRVRAHGGGHCAVCGAAGGGVGRGVVVPGVARTQPPLRRRCGPHPPRPRRRGPHARPAAGRHRLPGGRGRRAAVADAGIVEPDGDAGQRRGHRRPPRRLPGRLPRRRRPRGRRGTRARPGGAVRAVGGVVCRGDGRRV